MKKKLIIIGIIAAVGLTITFIILKKKKPCPCLSQNNAIENLTEDELKDQIAKVGGGVNVF